MALYEDYAVCLKGIPVPSSIKSFMKSWNAIIALPVYADAQA